MAIGLMSEPDQTQKKGLRSQKPPKPYRNNQHPTNGAHSGSRQEARGRISVPRGTQPVTLGGTLLGHRGPKRNRYADGLKGWPLRMYLRLRAIEILIRKRAEWGDVTVGAREYFVAAPCILRIASAHGLDRDEAYVQGLRWAQRNAPNLSLGSFSGTWRKACDADGCPTGDAVGKLLQIQTWEIRELGLRMVNAMDRPKAVRKAERREKRRLADEERRRRQGARPRSESLSRTKPWEAAGISRAQWYRRKAVGSETKSGGDA